MKRGTLHPKSALFVFGRAHDRNRPQSAYKQKTHTFKHVRWMATPPGMLVWLKASGERAEAYSSYEAIPSERMTVLKFAVPSVLVPEYSSLISPSASLLPPRSEEERGRRSKTGVLA